MQLHVGLEAGHLGDLRCIAGLATRRDHGRVAVVVVHAQLALVVGSPEAEGDEPSVQQAGMVWIKAK